jgi:F-type H+-transporting ATPase subunit beta
MTTNGKIKQIIGAVVDVQFPNQQSLPEIYNALTIVRPGGEKLILEFFFRDYFFKPPVAHRP